MNKKPPPNCYKCSTRSIYRCTNIRIKANKHLTSGYKFFVRKAEIKLPEELFACSRHMVVKADPYFQKPVDLKYKDDYNDDSKLDWSTVEFSWRAL